MSRSIRGASSVAPSQPTSRECRIRASLLLKAIRSDDPARALAAAERFRTLPRFGRLTPERVVAWRDSLRRKHALAVIAAELGFPTWTALLAALPAESPGTQPSLSTDWLFDTGAVYLNHWCTTYDDAASIRAQAGGFLFPYRHQFVVCTAERLASRGVDAYDPDWELIGFDWVRPLDRVAFDRLAKRLAEAGLIR